MARTTWRYTIKVVKTPGCLSSCGHQRAFADRPDAVIRHCRASSPTAGAAPCPTRPLASLSPGVMRDPANRQSGFTLLEVLVPWASLPSSGHGTRWLTPSSARNSRPCAGRAAGTLAARMRLITTISAVPIHATSATLGRARTAPAPEGRGDYLIRPGAGGATPRAAPPRHPAAVQYRLEDGKLLGILAGARPGTKASRQARGTADRRQRGKIFSGPARAGEWLQHGHCCAMPPPAGPAPSGR